MTAKLVICDTSAILASMTPFPTGEQEYDH